MRKKTNPGHRHEEEEVGEEKNGAEEINLGTTDAVIILRQIENGEEAAIDEVVSGTEETKQKQNNPTEGRPCLSHRHGHCPL